MESLTETQERTWGAVSNLDTFFQRVYEYHSEKGFWPLVLGRITNLLTLAFTIAFSTFLFAFVDWSSLFSCRTADECSAVQPFRSEISSRAGEALLILYVAVFSAYWLWHLVSFLYSLRDWVDMRQFFSESLGISDEELSHMEWSVVVDRIVKLQERVRISIVKDLTALDITNRIMRKENYMIALLNASPRVLSLSLPCLPVPSHELAEQGRLPPSARTPLVSAINSPNSPNYVTLEEAAQAEPAGREAEARGCRAVLADWLFWWNGSAMFGKVLEWNLKHCILDQMFDAQFTLRRDFRGEEGARRLSRRFVLWGVLNALLLPFIMVFMVIFFFLKHAEEFHSKRSYLGPRQWTPLAMWRMRELNELPHFFNKRLNLAQHPAQQYVQQFPSRLAAIIAQCLAYVSGAVVAVLLVLMLGDSSLLLSVHVWERSLVWHLAFFSAVLAISRAFIPEKGTVFEPHQLLGQVVAHTHYCPPSWRGKAHTQRVRDELARLYKPRLLIFAEELVSVLVAPLILCVSLPRCSEAIVRFLEESTIRVPGLGDICKFALFDLQNDGDPTYLLEQPQRRATAAPSVPALEQGKLEKSFLSFSINHPRFQTADPAASRLLSMLAANARADASVCASLLLEQQGGLAEFLRRGGVAQHRRGRLKRMLDMDASAVGSLTETEMTAAQQPEHEQALAASRQAKPQPHPLAPSQHQQAQTEERKAEVGTGAGVPALTDSDLHLVRSFAELLQSAVQGEPVAQLLASSVLPARSSLFAPKPLYRDAAPVYGLGMGLGPGSVPAASMLFNVLEDLAAEAAEEAQASHHSLYDEEEDAEAGA